MAYGQIATVFFPCAGMTIKWISIQGICGGLIYAIWDHMTLANQIIWDKGRALTHSHVHIYTGQNVYQSVSIPVLIDTLQICEEPSLFNNAFNL